MKKKYPLVFREQMLTKFHDNRGAYDVNRGQREKFVERITFGEYNFMDAKKCACVSFSNA